MDDKTVFPGQPEDSKRQDTSTPATQTPPGEQPGIPAETFVDASADSGETSGGAGQTQPSPPTEMSAQPTEMGEMATVQDPNLAQEATLEEKAPPPGPEVELAEGSVLGKCRIQKLLGRGGMGAVYKARHTTLDVDVAVKILPHEIANKNPQFAERFMREAKLAARIRHPNIIAVMDAEHDTETGFYYIVQEFVDGGSVRDLMRKGPVDEARALDIVIGVTEALKEAADFDIVHRDIKPDNIMLTKKGVVKLADLGIAKERSDTDAGITHSMVMMGTPAYMAPEQAMDAKTADARADIYSLGASLYHMLCGAPPFEGETTYSVLTKLATEPTPDPRQKRPDLSPAVAALIMKMMAKEKEQRPQSAGQLLDILHAVKEQLGMGKTVVDTDGGIKIDLPEAPFGTSATTTATAIGAGAQQNNIVMVAALVAVVVVALGAIWFATQPGSRRPEPPAASPAGTEPGGMETAGGAPMRPERPGTPGEGSIGDLARDTGTAVSRPGTRPGETGPGELGIAPTGLDRTQPGTGTPGGDTGTASGIARTPGQPPAGSLVEAMAAPAHRTDPAFVETTKNHIATTPPDSLVKEGAIVEGVDAWPEEPEIKVAGFAPEDDPDAAVTARRRAEQQAVRTVVWNVVEEGDLAEKGEILDQTFVQTAEAYIGTTAPFEEGTEGGVYWVAMAVAPRTNRILRDLQETGVEVREIYDLIGRPTVALDIGETTAGAETGTSYLQTTLAAELGRLGVEVIDPEAAQRDPDIWIKGTSSTSTVGPLPFPGSSTDVYRADVDWTISFTFTDTGRTHTMERMSFNPGKVYDNTDAYLGFTAEEATRKSLGLAAEQYVGEIKDALVHQWLAMGSADYTVVVNNLGSGAEKDRVVGLVKGLEIVSDVTTRGYEDGTLEILVSTDADGQTLQRRLEELGTFRLTAQSGLRLEFSAVRE